MNLKKIVLLALVLFLAFGQLNAGKKYKFTFEPPYEIEQLRPGQVVDHYRTQLVKSWALDKNPDKAIIKAQQNAVAAAMFTGIAQSQVVGASYVPPICGGPQAYEANKDYFDKFFTSGEFMNYVINVNSTYPTGEDNVKTPNGRRVAVYLQLMYGSLQQRLLEDGIIKNY